MEFVFSIGGMIYYVNWIVFYDFDFDNIDIGELDGFEGILDILE